MTVKIVDKNNIEIKAGCKVADGEGIYDVIEYDGELAIASEKSIWKLSQFNYDYVMENPISFKFKYFDFEVVR